jgi:AraC-like DNA-binding protein
MIYRKFLPSAQLANFVECYYVWHSSGECVHDLVVESPPNGFCSIVFNSGDDYSLQNKKYPMLPVPRQFIAGQAIYSYKLFLNGRIDIAGVVLKPTALASLFQLPVFEYTEERVPLDSIFDRHTIETLGSGIAAAGDENEKARLLENFLLSSLPGTIPGPDAIDTAANAIIEKNGMVDVAGIIKNAFMSRRNFERKFFKKVGLSPKYYARLRRMSHLMNVIAGKKKADWASLFTECAFYDQSHFIRDFMEFTGRTPEQYLKENAELANMVPKPVTGKINS